MAALGRLVGPVILGLGAWCAAGTVAIVAPDVASVRYAAMAPWWVFAAAVVVGALLPAIRNRPLAALPALLSTVAWWPVPLPPIALIFSGPLAWLPVAVAVGIACGLEPLWAAGRALGLDRPSRAPWVAGVLAFACISLSAWSAAIQVPGGDEPHYLVITQSLLKDGDLRVDNNYEHRDYAPYYGGHLDPHYLVRGKDGAIYSVHAPGLAVLVLPGFALAGYRGAQLTVMLLAAVTSALLWIIGWRVSRNVGAAWFAWAAIVTATTFQIQGFTIYPDGPGMFAVALGVWLLLRLSDTTAPASSMTLVAASLPLAALPWLHSRFAVVAAVFGAAVALRLLTDTLRPLGARVTRLAAFAVLPFLSAAAWFGFFKAIYGSFNPSAPYGDTAGAELRYIPAGSVAILFDGQFGLMTYAPVLITAIAGWWRPIDRIAKRVGIESLSVIAAYLAVAMTYWMWWGGNSPPARFFAPMLPLFAVPLASVWVRGDAWRRALLTTLVLTGGAMAACAIGAAHGAVAWNERDGQSRLLEWLGPLVNLRRGWPAFFWTLAPDFSDTNLSSEWIFVGRIALFLGVWTVAWFAARTLVRPWAGEDRLRRRAVVGGWLLVGLVLVVQAGWIANGVGGLDAERAQAHLLTAANHGESLVAIQPGHVSRRAVSLEQVTIAGQELGKFLEATPAYFAVDLPAGDYMLTLTLDRPVTDTMTLAAGDDRVTFPVKDAGDRRFPIHVAHDGSRVVVAADAIQAAGGTFTLSPRAAR
jgi:hypothetical protein